MRREHHRRIDASTRGCISLTRWWAYGDLMFYTHTLTFLMPPYPVTRHGYGYGTVTCYLEAVVYKTEFETAPSCVMTAYTVEWQ